MLTHSLFEIAKYLRPHQQDVAKTSKTLCACVRACARACVRVCVCVCVCVRGTEGVVLSEALTMRPMLIADWLVGLTL